MKYKVMEMITEIVPMNQEIPEVNKITQRKLETSNSLKTGRFLIIFFKS